MIIALLTARSGSTRLPNKNIKDFCGVPLLVWSIVQAKCSKWIDEVCITTDSKQYAEIALEYGAKVIMRPVYDNNISAGYVLKLAVEELFKQNINSDEIVYMLPTSPLKKPSDLDNLIGSFHETNKYDTIYDLGTYSPDKECFVYRNVDNMLDNYGKAYKLVPVIADKGWNYSRSVGGWGIAKTSYLMDFWNNQGMYDSVIDGKLKDIDTNKAIYGFGIEPWQCFETDYEDQFKLCELIMEQFILKGRGIKAYTDYARSIGKEVNFDKQLNLLQDTFTEHYL